MEIVLIDAIGPFFRGLDRRRINWSKIPFEDLPLDAAGGPGFWDRVAGDMDTFCGKAVSMGFNAVTLDDVAHLIAHPLYEPAVRERCLRLQQHFQKLCALIRTHGLAIYFTSDFLTTTPAVRSAIGRSGGMAFYKETIELFFDTFPMVSGIVLRIGECDGVDVSDPLRSSLGIRSSNDVNRLLREVLPIFERNRKRLIFRTWTVGAARVGDLIWHAGRLRESLRGIDSPALVVSMKPGESDFFRYLPLNRQFFRTRLPKIIELQARREYEGAGEFPSFIGWDLENTAAELQGAGNVIGLSVWCQTGGWHRFRRLAFLSEEDAWITLNARAAVEILANGHSVRQAVALHFGEASAEKALEFLRLSEEVILRLLYIEEFARQKLFFRRVRIPPIIHVYWDGILVIDPVREILRRFVADKERAIRQGEEAFAIFPRLIELAQELGMRVEDIEFMRDTLNMVRLARQYYFAPFSPALIEEIEAAKTAYKVAWPRSRRPRYRIKTSFEKSPLHLPTARWLLLLSLRRRRGYRTVLDRFFTLNLLAWLYRAFGLRNRRHIPKFLRKSAMGIDSVLR
ncbi:MAG: hypothetical protein Fur0032_04810 [Terrimicrobiaceae bacterium]